MNRSNGPISPLSMNNANSFASRYGPGASGPPPIGGTPNDVPYAGGPYGASRPSQTSPPGSQHPSGSTDASRPSVSSSTMRPPSSASSLGGRSDGRMGFGGAGARDSGRSTFQPENEEALQRHYHVLKGYLAASLRDEKGNLKPNRARDKLLRLSVTQFMELSTDVFDELVRREDDRLQRVKDVPRFLLPKPMFHPKRNQARQKLSTLPIERFRQLATDVFYELERRIPRFGGDEIDRPMSTTSNGPPGSRAPSRGGMRGPPPPGYRGPPGGPGRPPMPPGPNGMGPPQMPYQSFRPNSPGMNGPPGPPPPGPMRRPSEQSEPGSLGRPLPKTFQSNTIVPNKSTMVEDDDEDDEDTFGLDKGVRYSEAPSSSGGNEKDRETIKSQEAEITRLKEQVEDLEMKSSADNDFHAERDEWATLREELEQKVSDAQHLADNVRNELEMLRRNKTQDELDIHNQHDATLSSIRADLALSQNETSDLRAQVDALQTTNADLTAQLSNHHAELTELRQQAHDTAHTSRSLGSEEQERRLALLENELAQQEKLTNDVRAEAHAYLNEMRDLSRQHELQTEREERLETRVAQLEADNETWRTRYARVKTQNKNLRASTLGLGMIEMSSDASSVARDKGLVSSDGLVKPADLTRFQLSLDDLLRAAREPSTPALLAAVKTTTVCVSAITATSTPDPSPLSPSNPTARDSHATNGAGAVLPPQRLRARALGSANTLITSAKHHAASSGLSPVSLLDAAAGNCCAAVLEYVRAVRIAPLSAGDLDRGDEEADAASLYDGDGYGSDGAGLSTELVRGGSLDEVVGAMPLPPGRDGGDVKPLNTGGGGAKKGGWFGWGRGTASEDSDRDGGAGGEYDPYR